MAINKEVVSQFTDYLYNRLPQMYRTADKEDILKRFIEVFSEGGFKPLLQDTINIMDILDVDKCPSKYLPLLCQMYGYEYTLELPELFQRRLLKYIVELYKRKGTKSVVRFIARELTGFESEIIENMDFNQKQIELTKWDIKFENHRNFILKLTAPYEDSILYNKEEIVVKLVNDFLPTNSQVFVITAYWFREESEIVKKSMEDIFDLVNDYNKEVYNHKIKESDVKSVLNTTDTEKHTFYGEESSFLNSCCGLTTNAINMKDVVRFALESYNSFLKAKEVGDNNTAFIDDGTFSNALNKYINTYNLDRVKDKKLEETHKRNITKTIHEKVKGNPYIENRNLDMSEVGEHHVTNTSDKEEFLKHGSINFKNYDIMGTVNTETFKPPFLQRVDELSLLNNTSDTLWTNGMGSFDIIKEKGKPNKVIMI